MELFLYIFILLLFYFLNKNYILNIRIILFIFFLLSSFLLNYLIINDQIRDYFTYTRVLTDKGYYQIVLKDLFYEPYFIMLSKFLLKYFTIPVVLNIYYTILYLTSTLFFSWLVFETKLSSWKKNILFNFFYILFSFVLIRNGLVYMIFALFFYQSSLNRKFYIQYASFFIHLTSIPILFLSLFKSKKINFYIIPIAVILLASTFFLFLDKSSILYLKYIDYKKNSVNYNYLIHYVIFFLTISLFIYLFFKFNLILSNYFFTLMVFIYITLFYFNAVMGFRFSFYIFLYLLMNTSIVFNKKTESILNRYSFLFILIGFLSFKLFLFV